MALLLLRRVAKSVACPHLPCVHLRITYVLNKVIRNPKLSFSTQWWVLKYCHWRREVWHSAEVLVLCTSVLAISVSEKDGQADLRHVCFGPRVSTCASTLKPTVFWFSPHKCKSVFVWRPMYRSSWWNT